MQATIELSDQEFSDLKSLTQQADAAAAVRTAMIEYLRYARRMKLKELSGKVKMDDNWRDLEALELADQNGDSDAGVH